MISLFRKLLGYRFPRLGAVAFRLFYWLAPKKITAELFPNIWVPFAFEDLTMKATFWQGKRFESPTCDVLSHWLAQGASQFFDIGSNYGFFSYFLLSESPHLVVDAFEPNPKTNLLVQSIIRENGLDRMRVHHLGLSNQKGNLTLRTGIEDSGHSTFGNHPHLEKTPKFEVSVKRFDDWRKDEGVCLPEKPEWIAKIDVEGFEMNVLEGMIEALGSKAFIGLVVEVNEYTLSFCGRRPQEIYEWLLHHGYRRLDEVEPKKWNYSTTANAFFVPA